MNATGVRVIVRMNSQILLLLEGVHVTKGGRVNAACVQVNVAGMSSKARVCLGEWDLCSSEHLGDR